MIANGIGNCSIIKANATFWSHGVRKRSNTKVAPGTVHSTCVATFNIKKKTAEKMILVFGVEEPNKCIPKLRADEMDKVETLEEAVPPSPLQHL